MVQPDFQKNQVDYSLRKLAKEALLAKSKETVTFLSLIEQEEPQKQALLQQGF